MGNVLASSKAASNDLQLAPAPNAEPLPIDSADPTKTTGAGSLLQGYTFDGLENPGSMEELHKRCKGNGGSVPSDRPTDFNEAAKPLYGVKSFKVCLKLRNITSKFVLCRIMCVCSERNNVRAHIEPYNM